MKRFDLRSSSTQLMLAWLVLALLMLGYTLWMSQQAALRYDTFKATAFDLGNMDQVMWNTAHGNWFQWTNQGADWYGPPIRLAQHFEPIILLLSLLYLIHADPRVLLIFQTVVLVAGALPVFLLTRSYLPRFPLLAPVMAAAYLFSSALIGLNIFDFHPVSLATTLLLYAALALTYRRYGWFLLACCLAAACKEDVPFTVALFGILVIWKYKLPRLGTILIAGGLLWGMLAFLVIIPHFFPGQHNNFWYRYESLGSTPGAAVVNILLHPWILLATFLTLDRFNYLASLFRGAGFLSLLAPEWLLPAIPSLAVNLLSINDPLLYSGVYHYNATIIPFVMLAAIHGMVRFVAQWERWRGIEVAEETSGAFAARADAFPNAIGSDGSSPAPSFSRRLFERPLPPWITTFTQSLIGRFSFMQAGLVPATASSTSTIVQRQGALYHGISTVAHFKTHHWQRLSDRMAPLCRSLSQRAFHWLLCLWIVAMLTLNYFIMVPWFNIFWATTTPGTHEQAVQRLLDMIPPDASVSAGTNLNPHLTERRYITVFPALTFATRNQDTDNTVQYIIVDLNDIFPEDKTSTARMLNQLCQSGQFHVIQRAEGVILLQRS